MKKSVPLIVGNWKLNPSTLKEATTLASAVARKHKKQQEPYVAVAPSSIHIIEVQKKIAKSSIYLAAQNVSHFNNGAHTGEISVAQLKDSDVSFVIVGHSERRATGVTNEDVQKKVSVLLKASLTPIVCVGENDRDDQGNFFTFIEEQLRTLADGLSSAQMKKIVIAYEPIWAIGTGVTATVDDVKEMQLFVQTVLTKLYDRPTARNVRLLYGGSVKPQNAAKLHAGGGMNGFLVGGASLKADDFAEIIKAVSV